MTLDAEPKAPKLEPHEPEGEYKLSWGRFLQFGKNILDLERSVTALKAENKALRTEVREMQRQLDELSGEMRAVSKFISGAMDDKIDARVEKAEIRAFERLLSMVRGTPRGIE